MPTPIPGNANLAISFSCVGSPHISVITLNTTVGSATTASGVNTALRNAMAGAGSALRAVSMSTAFAVVNTYVLANFGGLLFVDNNPTVITGTATLNPPPLNTAVIIRKNTAVAGRQYRGRMFVPPLGVDEASISAAGIITPTQVTAISLAWESFRVALVGQGLTPYLTHSPPLAGPTPPDTLIQSFSCTPLIGSIKRRIRQ